MIFKGTMILTDLDGTLLDSKGLVSPENRAAAEYYVKNGGLFSLATGRSFQGMRYFVEELPVNAPAIIHNGSMAYDFQKGGPAFAEPLPPETLEMMEDAAAAFPHLGIELYTVEGAFVPRINDITRRHLNYVKIPIVERPAREIPSPWISLVMTIVREDLFRLQDYIHEKYPDTFFLQPSLIDYLEVQNKITNKGWGALRLCEHMGIEPENLYVAGDGSNDVELISCTKNAFAPANAVEQILALGPTVLADNDSHAIADLIGCIERERKGAV